MAHSNIITDQGVNIVTISSTANTSPGDGVIEIIEVGSRPQDSGGMVYVSAILKEPHHSQVQFKESNDGTTFYTMKDVNGNNAQLGRSDSETDSPAVMELAVTSRFLYTKVRKTRSSPNNTTNLVLAIRVENSNGEV